MNRNAEELRVYVLMWPRTSLRGRPANLICGLYYSSCLKMPLSDPIFENEILCTPSDILRLTVPIKVYDFFLKISVGEWSGDTVCYVLNVFEEGIYVD